MAASEAVAVCRIARAEAFAAFSHRARETPADGAVIESAKRALARDWPSVLVLELSQAVVEEAGELADTFALRAYDAFQLAAARHAMEVTETPLQFACFDACINKAARLLGMEARFGL